MYALSDFLVATNGGMLRCDSLWLNWIARPGRVMEAGWWVREISGLSRVVEGMGEGYSGGC
jgi:hypothetical protein